MLVYNKLIFVMVSYLFAYYPLCVYLENINLIFHSTCTHILSNQFELIP